MRQRQPTCMQRDPTSIPERLRGPIAEIAHDRSPHAGQLDPDLMGTARHQLDFHQRVTII